MPSPTAKALDPFQGKAVTAHFDGEEILIYELGETVNPATLVWPLPFAVEEVYGGILALS